MSDRVAQLDAVERTGVQYDSIGVAVLDLGNLCLGTDYFDDSLVDRQRTVHEGDLVIVCRHILRSDRVGTDIRARCVTAAVALCTKQYRVIIGTEEAVIRNGEFRMLIAVDHLFIIGGDGQRSLGDSEVNRQGVDIVAYKRYDSGVVTRLGRSHGRLFIYRSVISRTDEGQHVVFLLRQGEGRIGYHDSRSVDLGVVNECLAGELCCRDVSVLSGLAVDGQRAVDEGDDVVVCVHTGRNDGVVAYIITALVLACVCLAAGQDILGVRAEEAFVAYGELRSLLAEDVLFVVGGDGQLSLGDGELHGQHILVVADELYLSRVLAYVGRSGSGLGVLGLAAADEGQRVVLLFRQREGRILHKDGRFVDSIGVNQLLAILLSRHDVGGLSRLAVHGERTIDEGDGIVGSIYTARRNRVSAYVIASYVRGSVCDVTGQD